MKPVFQTRFGEPDGNCFAACVASIIECSLDDVPDLKNLPDGKNWLEWFNEGLSGFSVFHARASAEEPFVGYIPAGSHFIVAGTGRNSETKHCVVMLSSGGVEDHRDSLAHDPHPGWTGGIDVATTGICLILKR